MDWSESPEVLAAVVSGLLAIVGVLIGLQVQRRVERYRHGLNEEQRSRALVQRHQEPLARAAYDLQSRLYNIVHEGFLGTYSRSPPNSTTAYALESTVWLLAQYLGWVEIVRREAQFLRVPKRAGRRRLQERIDAVTHSLASDRQVGDPLFRVFRGEQRAIGEVMITEGQDAEGRPRQDCLGYAAFTSAYQRTDSPQRIWCEALFKAVKTLAEEPSHTERAIAVQRALVDLIDEIDTDMERFPSARNKLSDEPLGSRRIRPGNLPRH